VTAPSRNTEAVVVGTSDGSTSHQIPVLGPAAVGFAPSGSQVAFIGPGDGDRVAPLPLGPLRIVDAATGDVRTLGVKDVVAFFWSPDGRTIATLGIPSTVSPPAATVGDEPATARLASVREGPDPARPTADAAGVDVSLVFVDVASGAATTPAVVSLTSLFVNQVLPYFDQYALSHKVWSPDGTSILLPIVTADGVETLESLPKDGSAARVLAPGSIGFWSP
jgi:TolB protein